MPTPDPPPPAQLVRTRFRFSAGAATMLVIAALVIAVAVSAFWPRGSARTVPDPVVTVESAAEPTAEPILVHVLGAVRAPGLFELAAGSRVVDAIAAAGGLTPGADTAGVNLARPVSDGEQVRVPQEGEQLPPNAGAPAGARTINLNSATTTELETLPGVGPALAARIIAWRQANGRFRRIDDLLSVSGIGQQTFAELRKLVTV